METKINNILYKNIDIKELFIKIKNFLVKYLVEITIITNVLYTLIASYMLMKHHIYQIDYANGQILLAILNALVIMFMISKKTLNKSKKTTYIFMVLIVLFTIISAVFAKRPRIAITGNPTRNEGVLAIMYYLSLMFLATMQNKNTKKIIINLIIITGIIQGIYGICQTFKLPFVHNPIPGRALGFITNQNFFGALMLLCLSFSIGLYIEENKIIKKIVYIIESIVLTTALLMAYTTSVVVGMLVVTIFIAIYCIRKKKTLKLIVVLCILASTTFITNNLGKSNTINDIKQTSQEVTEITKGNAKDSYGSGRIFLWKETIKIIPKYFLIGAGVDNFYYAFGTEPLTTSAGWKFDKAHNEYLQTLITEGIFGLLSYIGLYIIVLKKGIKNSFKNEKIYFVLPIIGYLVQAFFNISVIEVAPIFYIALGLIEYD